MKVGSRRDARSAVVHDPLKPLMPRFTIDLNVTKLVLKGLGDRFGDADSRQPR